MFGWGGTAMNFIQISVELLLATLAASLLGSSHCVAMCGPFAFIASRTSSDEEQGFLYRMGLYHVGRLVTYILLASVLRLFVQLGISVDWLSEVGWVVGGILVALGSMRLIQYWLWSGEKRSLPLHAKWVNKWSEGIAAVRRAIPRGSANWNSFSWGLTTSLLPCGWLYIFAIASIAAPSFPLSLLSMVAFWLGTLPWLSTVIWGWDRIGQKWKQLASPVSACVILLMGGYLILSRSTLDLSAFVQQRLSFLQRVSEPISSREQFEKIRRELNQGLPCCQDDNNSKGSGNIRESKAISNRQSIEPKVRLLSTKAGVQSED